MEFLNSKSDLYLGGAVNQVDTLSDIEYICSSDPTQSDVPLSDYLVANLGRIDNITGFIAKVGLYNYVINLSWQFTTAKSQYDASEFWNIISLTGSGTHRPFHRICRFGFQSLYRDGGAGGLYPGMLTYFGVTKSSMAILPFTNIVVADLDQHQDKTFKTTACWTSF